MKLIINTSNIVIGGGIQVSLSFLEALISHPENEYHIFLSPKISEQLDKSTFQGNFKFYKIPISPSSLLKGFKTRKKLSLLESQINPDLVFTVFGPAYWNPKSLHVSGFANGWCYTPNSIAFNYLPRLARIKSRFLITIKNYFIKKSDFLIVETDTAKKNIISHLKIKEDKIFVVGNTFHQVFESHDNIEWNAIIEKSKCYKLLVLSSFYPHKNLLILNKVVEILREKSHNKFKFFLTIPDDKFNEAFPENDMIENLGPQNIQDCPGLYKSVDALFLPTLLETFTANYPEAMVMRKPILTSDLDFARELCGDAALYFNPLSVSDITEKIMDLEGDESLKIRLVTAGDKRLKEFETAESRTNKYLEIFKKLKA
ncbi:hypothetical protein KCTC52924_02966 [Arenibacter antarcticus]|uniref:Glycosyltransferase n=1 Tax=Arenibacter antarcticus TaxID=2040469 RepID=A0ABW5VFN6_9FLAO|nr:glycosyltransferase [Arenibacter sp. H213]MCM4167384.1 hypothetical protein [Arenibacter sp. H213]